MSVLCSWASIGENGKATGGKAGDQTGRECKNGPWYYFGQTQCFRWKSATLAHKFAVAMKFFCDSPLVGYAQDGRITLYNALKKVNWDYKKLKTKVNCDCSMLIACAINCAVGRAVIPPYVYTGNLKSLLMTKDLFVLMTGSKYTHFEDYLMEGDILNAPGHHVIASISHGHKSGKKKSSTIAEPTLKRGSTGSQVKKLQAHLNKLGYTNADGKSLSLDGIFGMSTQEALRKFQKAKGLTVDGIYGSKTYAKMKSAI